MLLAACVTASEPPARAQVRPVTEQPWREAAASVTDLDASARFLREIGGYEDVWRGPLHRSELDFLGLPAHAAGEALLLRAPASRHGFVRLVRIDGAPRTPMRPGARPWDTGCFFSLMVRARDLDAIYDDAIRLGWWTETPVTNLDFGGSRLRVVIFQGPDGLNIQAYERLSPALPEAFGDFERISQPFNMMQMVRAREPMRALAEDVLGFGRYWYGPPHVEATPTHSPLGIPYNLTTSVAYAAGIFSPAPGEFGRLEAIEIAGLEGRDHSSRCDAPNLGWLSVSFPVADAYAAAQLIEARGWPLQTAPRRVRREPDGDLIMFRIKTPDGANLDFFAPAP